MYNEWRGSLHEDTVRDTVQMRRTHGKVMPRYGLFPCGTNESTEES